jgi:hypothetical protein
VVTVQNLVFLGILLNSSDGRIFVPVEKMLKVKNTIADIFTSLKVHRRVGVIK